MQFHFYETNWNVTSLTIDGFVDGASAPWMLESVDQMCALGREGAHPHTATETWLFLNDSSDVAFLKAPNSGLRSLRSNQSNEDFSFNEIVSVYPNPVESVCWVNYKLPVAKLNYSYSLYDALGAVVLSGSLSQASGILEIDMKNFADGVYHFVVYSSKNVIGSVRVSKTK